MLRGGTAAWSRAGTARPHPPQRRRRPLLRRAGTDLVETSDHRPDGAAQHALRRIAAFRSHLRPGADHQYQDVDAAQPDLVRRWKRHGPLEWAIHGRGLERLAVRRQSRAARHPVGHAKPVRRHGLCRRLLLQRGPVAAGRSAATAATTTTDCCYHNPAYTFQLGRMRQYDKPNWYLPMLVRQRTVGPLPHGAVSVVHGQPAGHGRAAGRSRCKTRSPCRAPRAWSSRIC